MMCAGCSARVDKTLSSIEGVREVSVSLPQRTATIDYDERITTPEELKKRLAATGYDLVVEHDRNVEAIERRAYEQLRRRVVLSWLFAVFCMAVSMKWLEVRPQSAANQTMMLIALCNLVYCGRSFYATAWKQLTHLSANMDTLVALSTGISFLYSTIVTFWGEQLFPQTGAAGGPYTYFDASVMIITFVLTGRLIEEHAKRGTASAIRSLMGLQPKTARVVASPSSTEEVQVPLSALQVGDVIEVRVGEKVPVDGVVVSGEARMDESAMTGESELVSKTAGDPVLSGTLVKSGTLCFRAQQVGEKTVLANMIRMVQEAQSSKAPVQRLVDRMALVFVPAVGVIAVLTFVVWLLLGGTGMLPQAVLSAVSVLVIACPCAMGLATPTALMVGIGRAAQQNILIKDATALEQIHRINALVTDKTGTITHSVPADGGESLKPHAAEAMAELKAMGVELHMMSGDKEEKVSRWAREAGIDHWQSGVLPQDKENLVRRLQAEGKTVAMVGDGVNDSQALAVADVSIAMGSGTDVAMDVAQLTLMSSDLRRIPEAIRLSRHTVGMIRQNLFWAFIYNIICIPLAAGILQPFCDFQITPMWAAALMAMSSVSVVLNSLRLKLM